jgi:hypothetical protein
MEALTIQDVFKLGEGAVVTDEFGFEHCVIGDALMFVNEGGEKDFTYITRSIVNRKFYILD